MVLRRAEWEIKGGNIANGGEDRFLVTPPEGGKFEYEIHATGEEENEGPMRCVVV